VVDDGFLTDATNHGRVEMYLVDINGLWWVHYIVDEFQSNGTFKATYAQRLKMRREKFMTDLTKLL
jgi:hypothetical protein